MPYLFFKNLQIRIYELKFFNCSNFNILLWFLNNLINDNACVSAATPDACSMVHLVCLFVKTHLLALLQDNYLDLVRCASLRKLSTCVRNITAFCQHLLRPIKSAVLADTWVKPKYRPRPIYISICNANLQHRWQTSPWSPSVYNLSTVISQWWNCLSLQLKPCTLEKYRKATTRRIEWLV